MAGEEFYRSAQGEEDNSTLSGSGRPGHYFGGGASEEAGSYNPQGKQQIKPFKILKALFPAIAFAFVEKSTAIWF